MTTIKNISPADETSLAPLQRQPNPRQRILVVDDDKLIRRLNTEVLAYSGYDVDSAVDGADAWRALQLDSYDLIVIDNNMPKLSGVGLLQKLHASRISLPVIMATGTFPQEELSRHPWLQINATLLKPYTFDELLETVKWVLWATTEAGGELSPPPNWQGHLPPAVRP